MVKGTDGPSVFDGGGVCALLPRYDARFDTGADNGFFVALDPIQDVAKVVFSQLV